MRQLSLTLVALSVLSPLAALVHVLHEQHTVCSEHAGEAHHDAVTAHTEAYAALKAMPSRFPEPHKAKAHDHCGVIGAFERACEKDGVVQPLTPARAPADDALPPKRRALPDVVYAYAPKTSPPAIFA